MWRNIRISSKLLLGFGLLLAVFLVSTELTWRDMLKVATDSKSLTNDIVPTLKVTTDIERSTYDFLLAEKDYMLLGNEIFLKEATEKFDKLKSLFATMDDIRKTKPYLATPKYLEEKVGQAFRDYVSNLQGALSTVAQKDAAFNKMAQSALGMSSILDDALDAFPDMVKNLAKDSDLPGIERTIGIWQVVQDIFQDVATLRISLLRSSLDRDINGVGATLKNLDKIRDNVKQLQAIISSPEIRTMFADLAGVMDAYDKNLKDYVAVYSGYEEAMSTIGKFAETMNAETTNGSILSTGRVVEIADDTFNGLTHSIRFLIISAAVALVIGVIIALLISRSISKPLNTIVDLAARAEEGDLTIKREEFNYNGKDELAKLAQALSVMISSQETTLQEVVSVAENLSNGVKNLAAISEEAGASMGEIEASVNQITKLSESNGSALEECNAGVEEMSAGADTVAQSATDSAAFISQTTDVTNHAVQMVDSTIKGMRNVSANAKQSEDKLRQLVTSVQNVTGFVTVITSIADQTNLLALNAAIEAARAGEVGRGFAVVAEEVRKLAEESAKAAQSVNSIIRDLQGSAQDSIDATTEAGRLLVDILSQAEDAQEQLDGAIKEINKANNSIQNIAAVAEEQAASSREVATGIDNVTKSTIGMVSTIKDIGAAVETTTNAARGTATEAEVISSGVEKLMGVLSHFKLNANGGVGGDKKNGVKAKLSAKIK
ncbi:hypothetical protein AGMMS49957_02040 [Synergistales bacterium]|nr:hypothetical protein AGMMS49957_02040 [Synergistales bacterium]